MFFRQRRPLLLLLLLSVACRQNAAVPSLPPRYAILRFENLSGDPTLDWTGRAIGESLPISLAGALDGPVLGSSALNRLAATLGPRPASAPGVSSGRSQALLAGANHVIAGYVEGTAGHIRIAATEEDLLTGKSLRIVTATGASPMAALDRLAHEFSPHPGPFPTSNPEALRAWATALESPPATSEDLLEQAIHLDPDFGTAWVSLVGLDVSRGNRAAAEDALEQARRHKLDELSRANLDLEAAELGGTDRDARIAAMRRIVSLSPADTVLLQSLADAETGSGRFEAAASDWKKVTAALPNQALAWNSLGYTLSYAGDYAGALTALREYARLRPNDANPFDSIGDLNYSFRKFGEAAASYLEAHKKQPDFERYGDLYKAAWAKFRAGDNTGADALFTQFHGERTKSSDLFVELIAADWLYRTGREREAITTVRQLIADAKSGPLRADAYAQAAVWDLLRRDRAQAAKDAGAIGPKIDSPSVFLAHFAALPSAPADEWESRAQKMVPPSMTTLRQLALGYALLLDGKREAALPLWKQIVDTSSATDFFARAVYARLQGKTPERPLLPDPAALNPFAAIPDKL